MNVTNLPPHLARNLAVLAVSNPALFAELTTKAAAK